MEYTRISKKIKKSALKALLYEVIVGPKPGLVDRYNNGSHSDMNIFTFIDSSIELEDYFEDCCIIALENSTEDYDEIFNLLRKRGQKAEDEMFFITKNINTHKGAIFSLGLVSAASALSFLNANSVTAENISYYVKKLYSKAYYDDLNNINKENLTAGEKIYLNYGIHGVRREVSEGFPTVFNHSLPFLLDLEKKNLPFNDICIYVLLKIISKSDDTNIISRGGREGLDYAKDCAVNILENIAEDRIDDIKNMDLAFISKNLSPGGSADLLAVTLMIYFLIKN